MSGPQKADNIRRLVAEAQALTSTYLEGVGILAWRESQAGDRYEMVPLPPRELGTGIDDVLYRIESEIKAMAPQGEVPPPVRPPRRSVDVAQLVPDEPASAAPTEPSR